MSLIIDSRIKPFDDGILVLQIEFEVETTEHISHQLSNDMNDDFEMHMT